MNPRRRTVSVFVMLCLGHVLLISSQVPSRHGSSVLNATAFGSIARVQAIFGGFFDGIGGLWSRYVALGGASRENETLRARVLELEGELQSEQARSARVDSLEEALKLQRSVVAPTLAARVIAGNPMPGVLTVTVDRGTADGVRANTAVINGRGVVGRVVGSPSSHASVVQLLMDRAANAGAMLHRTGTAGNISGGHPDGLFRLELVSGAAEVLVGDRILTSGQDGIYPQGFVIGEVVLISGTGKSREIKVTPAVNFGRIDVVLILQARAPGGGAPRP